MIQRIRCRRLGVVSLLLALVFASATGCRKKPDAAATRKLAAESGQKGAQWLQTQQNEDGSITDQGTTAALQAPLKVGFTSLATIALLDQDLDENDPNVKRAVAFIAAQQKENGSISASEWAPNYETALATIALNQTSNSVYDQALQKAQTFLVGLQRGAGGQVDLQDPQYGGFGYGQARDEKSADLSNAHFALEALRKTELGADAEVFERAKVFVERCQNLQSVNKQPWATDDGGFIYAPGMSQANNDATGNEVRRSYGSMTYAGYLSFAYCNVPKDDPRVQAARQWLADNWTLDENPGMGQQGLYYYYMVMAKALSAYGEKYFIDSKGRRHFWALELANKIVALQHPDGYWVNSEPRWMENNKSLVTAYCMIALKHCQPFLAGE